MLGNGTFVGNNARRGRKCDDESTGGSMEAFGTRRVTALGIAALLALSACQPGTQTTAPAQPQEKRAARQVVRIASDGMSPTASPESSTQIAMFSAQFDAPMTLDKDLNILPGLAEKWESLPNGAGWRLSLRKDVTFSNGDQLTAADVEFTVKNFIENRLVTRGQFAAITDAKMVDQYTVDLVTARFDIALLYNMNYMYILPKAYHQRVGKDAFAQKPIGSGPYELVEYQPEQLHVYRKRTDKPHPWRKPQADELRWISVRDSTAAMNGVRLGELDILLTAITPDQGEAAKRDGAQLISVLSSNTFLIFDQGFYEKNNTPLRDKRVRQALNYAVDRDSLARAAYRGLAQPAGQFSTPGTLMWDESIKAWPYDVAQAKRLLAEAGYPNGFKMQGGLDYSTFFTGAALVVQAVQDYWKQVGVEVTLNQFEFATYLDKFRGQNSQTRNDVVYSSSGDPNGMYGIASGQWFCSLPAERRHFCVPGLEDGMVKAFQEVDPARRRQFMQQANRAGVAEVPGLFLLITPVFRVAGPKVRDLRIPNATFYDLDSVYLVE
jgi:peptide/nickel transport system substrate-binding protein